MKSCQSSFLIRPYLAIPLSSVRSSDPPMYMVGVLVIIATLTTIAKASVHTISSQNDHHSWEWSWSWTCKNGRCVRSDAPSMTTKTLTSQTICKLTCGKYGALWPQPTNQSILSYQVIAFHPSRIDMEYKNSLGKSAQEYLERVGKLWQGQLYRDCGADCFPIPETSIRVQLSVQSSDLTLNWNTDESYSLDISTNDNAVDVKIQSATVYGARHGYETLGQLVAKYSTGVEQRSILVMVSQARVADKPRFPHRGLLLDTARNYLPLSAIMRTIDGMAHVKLNVLHWHATDSQSFPISSPRVPQLAHFGAYSSSKLYTMNDITQVVEYGRLRGVRIIVEIDAPAHSGNGWQWGEAAGLGKLAVCVNEKPWRSLCIQPPCGQLNPTNPNIYSLLRDLYQDLIQVLPPGEAFHMGGDEVFFPCWNSSQEIKDYLLNRGQGLSEEDFMQLWSDFQATALRVFDEVNPVGQVPIILWSSHLTQPEVIDSFLDKSRYVIQTWVEANQTLPAQLLSKGYRLILATKDTWYLDHGFWGTTKYHSWRVAYDNKLLQNPGVLGGEAAMWAELVDQNSLDVKVWPRAAAVAERLWSDPTTSSLSAEARLQQLRKRLILRGITPDAISPEYCTQNEEACY